MTNTDINIVLTGDNYKIIKNNKKFYLISSAGKCIINDRLTKSDLIRIAKLLSIEIDKKLKKKRYN